MIILYSVVTVQKKFDQVSLLKDHQEFKHKNIDYFPCDYCLETFHSNISRRKHHSTKHAPSKSNSPISDVSNLSDSFVCSYCLDNFLTNESLEKHLKEIHKHEEPSRDGLLDGIYSTELQQQLDHTNKVLRLISGDK